MQLKDKLAAVGLNLSADGIAAVTATMPLRQLARPEDIARACVMLSSPAASRHITGEILTVAGGMEGRHLWSPADVDEAAVKRTSEAKGRDRRKPTGSVPPPVRPPKRKYCHRNSTHWSKIACNADARLDAFFAKLSSPPLSPVVRRSDAH